MSRLAGPAPGRPPQRGSRQARRRRGGAALAGLLVALALGAATACGGKTNVPAYPVLSPGVPRFQPGQFKPPAAPTVAVAYRLGPGDVISVIVHEHDELSLKEVPVLPDGSVALPLIGPVSVANRTLDEVRAEIEGQLIRFVVEPRISVTVTRVGSRFFSVLGRVNSPGVYPLEAGTRVLDGLARAGGFYASAQFRTSTVEIVDLRNTLLIRKGELVPVDFDALVSRTDLTHNVLLEPGDTIYIPSSLAREVHILGEVKVPQSVGFREAITLTQALARAEGVLFTGQTDDIQLVRGDGDSRKSYLIDLTPILDGTKPDVPLEPGDIVFVPPTTLAVWSRTIIQLLPFLQPLTFGSVFLH